MPEFNSFFVNSIKRITLDSVILTLNIKPELEQFYKFSAGQYVTLELEIDGVTVGDPILFVLNPVMNI